MSIEADPPAYSTALKIGKALARCPASAFHNYKTPYFLKGKVRNKFCIPQIFGNFHRAFAKNSNSLCCF
jgi:hypothetical protein